MYRSYTVKLGSKQQQLAAAEWCCAELTVKASLSVQRDVPILDPSSVIETKMPCFSHCPLPSQHWMIAESPAEELVESWV